MRNFFFSATSIFILFILAVIHFPRVSSVSAVEIPHLLEIEVPSTRSRYSYKVENKTVSTSYKTITIFDETKDACLGSVVTTPGRPGKIVSQIKVTFYDGQELESETIDVQIYPAQDEIITNGALKIYKNIDTPHGPISYWCKLENFLATSYDSTCTGCGKYTFTGMRQGYGIVATDPKVIPMYTKLYVPGYGSAIAGDIGGAVKGKKIDLGYDSLMGQWSRRYVDIYLL